MAVQQHITPNPSNDTVPDIIDVQDGIDRLRSLLAGLRMTCIGARHGLSVEQWNGLNAIAGHAEKMAEGVQEDVIAYRASLKARLAAVS